MKREEASAHLWPMLVDAAKHCKTYTYTQIAEKLGYRNPRVMGIFLDGIYWYCKDKGLPALTVLVVRKGDARPSGGLEDEMDVQKEMEKVYRFDWRSLKPWPAIADFKDANDRHPR